MEYPGVHALPSFVSTTAIGIDAPEPETAQRIFKRVPLRYRGLARPASNVRSTRGGSSCRAYVRGNPHVAIVIDVAAAKSRRVGSRVPKLRAQFRTPRHQVTFRTRPERTKRRTRPTGRTLPPYIESVRCYVASALAAVSIGCAKDAALPAVDAAIEFDVPSPTWCPANEPLDRAECSDALLRSCSYGDSPLPRCRASYWCEAKLLDGGVRDEQRWHRSSAPCIGEGNCPTSRPTDGTTCLPTAAPDGCGYPDSSLCFCVPDDAGAAWKCVAPGPGCPSILPNAGTPCTQPLSCTYGVWVGRCLNGMSAHCSDGHWFWSTGCGK